MDQDLSRDPSGCLNHVGQRGLCAKELPVTGKEDDGPGGDELLKRPTPGEPLASANLGPFDQPLVVETRGIHVGKEGVTDGGRRVPREHGVDGLGQFGAARLVNAARIYPYETVAVFASDEACFSDLR